MKKYIVRREAIKYFEKNHTYEETVKYLKERFDYAIARMTLYRWIKRLKTNEWDFQDISQKPNKLPIKFSEKERKIIEEIRKNFGYGSKKIRIQAQNKGIDMSISTVKRIIKQTGLSRGSKMEGIALKPKWVRFERPYPNDMWQIDGDQNDDGTWKVPVVDDCSRYSLGVYETEHNTTKAMIAILEDCIGKHGKPKQVLTDNGPEFGGTSRDSYFDKWCEKQGITHIRSGIHKPTTVGKISAMQRTIQAELPHWKGDLELWRMMYNHERPHESLRGLTPAVVYFQFKRHKKHYEL